MSDEKLQCDDSPDIDFEECVKIGKSFGMSPPFLLGIRGFEQPGRNVRGVYDDCIAIVDKATFIAFHANTDPSKYGEGIATLIAPQIVRYKLGMHGLNKELAKQYEALVQGMPVRVRREGIGEVPPGWFGINIHRGGYTTCGSEGCQTIHPDDWALFISRVNYCFRNNGLIDIKYLLVEI